MMGRVGFIMSLMVAVTASAADHQHIRGDQLEAKGCYILLAPKITMWVHRIHPDAGAWSVPEGNMICVQEVDRRTSRPWYRVLVIKMGTLDRSQHIPGWIDSRELEPHGVTSVY